MLKVAYKIWHRRILLLCELQKNTVVRKLKTGISFFVIE